MTLRCRLILALPFIVVLWSTPAAAQTGSSKVAIGGDISFKGSTNQETSGNTGVGLLWRLGRGRDGWGPTYGFNWYVAQLQTTIGGERQSFGELKLRPLTLGYGYSTTIRRVHASANVLAGIALTSFSLSQPANDAFRQELTAASLHIESSNPVVIRPEIGLWISVSRKVGINVNTGYMIAHPHVTIAGPNGQIERNVDANMFTLSVGAAYSIF